MLLKYLNSGTSLVPKKKFILKVKQLTKQLSQIVTSIENNYSPFIIQKQTTFYIQRTEFDS
jgi:hypothetical protein